VDLPQALELLSKKASRGGALRELGQDERSGETVDVREGRFGPYVKRGKVNASLPKDLSPADVTLEQAIELLDAREATLAEKGEGGKGGKKAAAKKATAKKAATKKTATTKAATKKATGAKAAAKKAATKKTSTK